MKRIDLGKFECPKTEVRLKLEPMKSDEKGDVILCALDEFDSITEW